jgi:hypothetical protein
MVCWADGCGPMMVWCEGQKSTETQSESTFLTMASLNHLCKPCRKYLGQEDEEPNFPPLRCPVCLDLWQSDGILRDKLHTSCQPYGGKAINHFSSVQAQILLPGDVALRYYVASRIASQEGGSSGATCVPFAKFQLALKEHLRSILSGYICDDSDKGNQNNAKQEFKAAQDPADKYPDCVTKQEQGYLSVHVLVTPSKNISRPQYPFIIKPKRNNRKRFRGNDPTEKQGGDPLVNQQQRLETEGGVLWTLVEADTAWSKTDDSAKDNLCKWFLEEQESTRTAASLQDDDKDETVKVSSSSGLELNVVVYRQPFYVRALYTKARRDVSQTPFYVPGDRLAGKTVMKRLGVTSIEEQIVGPLRKVCGGISRLNNNADDDDVVYGMIKFHGSGREDMNVRMTLPPPLANGDNADDGVGGRPFCCLVIDALRMPTVGQLKTVVEEINQTLDEEMTIVSNGARTYGKNPFGVGISSCLAFVPADAFKNLQADTEEKVKYYGCHCWSKDVIPSEQYLNDKLSKRPIELKQRTPVRVLHRRSNLFRKRHVLSLRATRIDDHYFRLNISTDAGTYVKEFVHGDLGRTTPSVSSLLGCKADILELDCEGIQQG